MAPTILSTVCAQGFNGEAFDMMATGSNMDAQHTVKRTQRKGQSHKSLSIANGTMQTAAIGGSKSEKNPLGYDPEHVRTAMREVLKRSGKSVNQAALIARLGPNTLGAFVGVHPTTNSPQLATAMAFARALGVSLSQFVGEHPLDVGYNVAEIMGEINRLQRLLEHRKQELLETRKRVAAISADAEEVMALVAEQLKEQGDL